MQAFASAAPNIVFVASLLLVSLLCAAVAVCAAVVIDKRLALKRAEKNTRHQRGVSKGVFALVGFVLAACVWMGMVGVLPLPKTSGLAWGAGLTVFALTAMARGLLRGVGSKRSERPQTSLAVPLAERKVA